MKIRGKIREIKLAEPSLDLLPKTIKEERKKVKIFHKLNIVGFVVFVVLASISAGIYFYYYSLENKSKDINSRIDKELSKIESFKEIDELANDIYVRYTQIRTIFLERPNYSELLKSITHITPPNVRIKTLTSNTPTKITVTGEAQGYIDLAKFIEAVADQADKEDGIFVSVTLNSVSLDRQTGIADFSLSLTLKEGSLTKKI